MLMLSVVRMPGMSRIDLVSKHLLANVFRNCRKRNTVIEKKLCQKILTNINLFA